MSEIRGRRNSRETAARPTNNHGPKFSTKDWRSRLILNDRGKPVANVANAITALRYAPEWRRVLHFNESKLATCAKSAPPFERTPAVPFTWGDEQDVLTAPSFSCSRTVAPSWTSRTDADRRHWRLR